MIAIFHSSETKKQSRTRDGIFDPQHIEGRRRDEMNKKVRKSLIWLLMFGVAVAAFGGGQSDSTVAVTDETAGEVIGYPIEGNIVLDYYCRINPNAISYIQSYDDNIAYQYIQERTGIDLNFFHPALGQEREQFNLMMVSGDLPDIIADTNMYEGNDIAGVQDGIFADLNPYLEKYAPDYYKVINSDEEVRREVYAEDGSVAGFYCINLNPFIPARRPMIRQENLDAVGMGVPKTVADYDELLNAFKEQLGIIPYVLLNTGKEEQFEGAFGVLSGLYLKDGGKEIGFGQLEPEYKAYLTKMNEWYEAGYISTDFPSLKNNDIHKLFDSGQIGTYIAAVVAAYNRGAKIGKVVQSAPNPRLAEGAPYHTRKAAFPKQFPGDNTSVSASSKYIKEAIRFLNYGYSEEGYMAYNFGVEGVTYNLINGIPTYTDLVMNHPEYGTENANYIFRVHFAPKLRASELDANPNLHKSPESLAIRKQWADDPTADSAFRIPPIALTSDEAEEQGALLTEINTYSDEMILRFIIGAESLANYDEYVAGLKSLGVDRAIEITQDAYDRYVSR